MAYAAAAYSDVTAFDTRAVALGAGCRAVVRTLAIGLGAVIAVAAMVSVVTMAAAWILAVVFSGNDDLRANAPTAIERVALAKPDLSLARASDPPAVIAALAQGVDISAATSEAELTAVTPPLTTRQVALAASIPALPAGQVSVREDQIPLPPRRPPEPQHIEAKADIVRPQAGPDAPEITASVTPRVAPPVPAAPPALPPVVPAAPPPPPAPARVAKLIEGPIALPLTHHDSMTLPGSESRTAVYDIAAHTVYLPNGERLEAHSGLGYRLDDPRYVSEKGRGATPPNVYDLTLRGELFHGVRAIRLNPVGDSKMFGRDGILAHTYMLGPSGQSFGCVSFKNYPEFLHAFLRGEVDRLVVVPHLDTTPAEAARAHREHPMGARAAADSGRA